MSAGDRGAPSASTESGESRAAGTRRWTRFRERPYPGPVALQLIPSCGSVKAQAWDRTIQRGQGENRATGFLCAGKGIVESGADGTSLQGALSGPPNKESLIRPRKATTGG